MDEHFPTVLDRALARLRAGEPIAQILADHAVYREELARLLDTAQELSLLCHVPPSADAQTGLVLFLDEARALRPARPPDIRRHWRSICLAAIRGGAFHRAAQTVICLVTIVVVLGGLLSSTIVLADDSLPGDAVYPAKLAGEEVRLTFTFHPVPRAEYHLFRVTVRVDELDRLVKVGRPIFDSTVMRIGRSLEASLIAAAAAAPDDTRRLLTLIERTAAEQAARLEVIEAAVARDVRSVSQAALPLLVRTHDGLAQAQRVARVGQEDVPAFRTNPSWILIRVEEGLTPFPGSQTVTSTPRTEPTVPVLPSSTPEVALDLPDLPGQATPSPSPTLSPEVETKVEPTSTPETPGPTWTATVTPTASSTPRGKPTPTPTPTPTRGQEKPVHPTKKPHPTKPPSPTKKP